MSAVFGDSSSPRSDLPWDLTFLRVGALVTGVLTAVAALVVGLTLSWADAVAVVVGAVVVTAFFCVSGLVIAWAGRIHDSYAMVAALGSFALKVLVLAAVLQALPEDGWLDLRVLAWTVIAGALVWGVVQARWVWTRQLLYVTPPAPRAAGGAPAADLATRPSEDPESRTTGG
ncbi:hypothetical protein [Modestobacter sp. NPDC049651]|uniref:hypothetical protein n=1 Tax=unclassified Modestobacter TaxID=2643866 RepID=UPI0034047D4B